MSCGLLLWVPWLCLISLLFGSSDGSPVITGYGFPIRDESNSLLGAMENEVLIPSIFNEIKWHASSTQPAGHVYEKYSKHMVIPLLDLSRQNHPRRPSARKGEKLVNGASRSWEVQNLDKRFKSPLGLNSKLDVPSKPLLGNHLQSPSLDVINASEMPISQRPRADTHSASQTVNPPPASSSPPQATSAFWIWYPKAFGSGYGVVNSGYGSQFQNANSSSHADIDDSNDSRLLFEEFFKYEPSQTGVNGFTSAPHSRGPSAAPHSAPEKLALRNYRKAWNLNPFWMRFPSFSSLYHLLNLNFSEMEKLLQTPFFQNFQNFKVIQQVGQPVPPPKQWAKFRLRPIHIAQSSNHYQRARFHQANTIYSQHYR